MAISSKEREQRAYMRYHQDGLADLLIGLGILLSGLTMLLDQEFPLAGVWVVLWLPIWMSAKKSITARRMHEVEVSREQYAGMWRAALFVASVLVLAVAAGLVALWGHQTGTIPPWFLAGLREYLLVVLGLFGAVVIGVAAWLSGLKRLYAYALLTGIASVLGYLVGAPIALVVTLTGGVVALWGVVLLIGFVRKYPVQQV